MRYIISTILILAISSPLLAQEKEKETDLNFISKKALVAIKKFEAENKKLDQAQEKDIKKIKASYAKDRKKHRLGLILGLEDALETEMKARNLDEAVKIRNAIMSLRKAKESPHRPLISDGIYHADFGDNPWTHEYHVKGNRISCPRERHDGGHFLQQGWSGLITQRNPNEVTINWDDGAVSRWTVNDTRILVEWWGRKSDKQKDAPALAVIHVKK